MRKSEEEQISTLIYSMGDYTEDLLESFNKKAKKYGKVKGNISTSDVTKHDL